MAEKKLRLFSEQQIGLFAGEISIVARIALEQLWPTLADRATATFSPTATATATATATFTPRPAATFTPSPTSTTPLPTPTATFAATATATPTATPFNCVLAQGYWKNHAEWPVTKLQLGNVTYNRQQLQSILETEVRINGLVALAHQKIAAKLNIAHGPNGSCIQQTLAAVDALIGNLVIRQSATDTCDHGTCQRTRAFLVNTTKASCAVQTAVRGRRIHARLLRPTRSRPRQRCGPARLPT